MAFDNTQKRSCLYDVGWISQKGGWLRALCDFAGIGAINDLDGMEKRLRAQLATGQAYVDINGRKVPESAAEYVRLQTGVVASGSKSKDGMPRYIVIKFLRNKYDLWEGLYFELGEVAEGQNAVTDSDGVASGSNTFVQDVYHKPEDMLEPLAKMAIEEAWHNEYGPYGMLLPYLRYTYARLKLEKKIVEVGDGLDNGIMAFNTGLVARDTLDPVIAVCDANAGRGQKWKFRSYVVWRELSKVKPADKILMQKIGKEPHPASWNFESIVLPGAEDCDCQAFKDIFAKRIPLEILSALIRESGDPKASDQMKHYKAATEANVRGEEHQLAMLYDALIKKLGGQQEAIDLALEILQRSVERAIKLARWEPETAVLMWNPKRPLDRADCLLPLAFSDSPTRAELALVLEQDETGKYEPRKYLPLKNAYSNARLLRRPMAFWLRDYIER